jgi:hypothetical protein
MSHPDHTLSGGRRKRSVLSNVLDSRAAYPDPQRRPEWIRDFAPAQDEHDVIHVAPADRRNRS